MARKAVRDAAIAAGKCGNCLRRKHVPDKKSCQKCLDCIAASLSRIRASKSYGQCKYGTCQQMSLPGLSQCSKHHIQKKVYRQKYRMECGK